MSEIDRRSFSAALAAGAAGGWPAPARAGEGGGGPGDLGPAAPAGGLTDVAGLRVGHFTDARRPTGCTVVLAEGERSGEWTCGEGPRARERPTCWIP